MLSKINHQIFKQTTWSSVLAVDWSILQCSSQQLLSNQRPAVSVAVSAGGTLTHLQGEYIIKIICKVVKRTNSLSYFFCYFSAIYNSKILRSKKYKKIFPAHLGLTQTADDVTLPAAEDWTWARSLQTHRTLHPLQLLSLPLPLLISHNLQEI